MRAATFADALILSSWLSRFTTSGPVEFMGGVPVFWRQLKLGHAKREFVHNPDMRASGIALLSADPSSK
jgi:hypothetical protein